MWAEGGGLEAVAFAYGAFVAEEGVERAVFEGLEEGNEGYGFVEGDLACRDVVGFDEFV